LHDGIGVVFGMVNSVCEWFVRLLFDMQPLPLRKAELNINST
jgi:hypothetical protein